MAYDPLINKCLTCLYYLKLPTTENLNPEFGECHRYPPPDSKQGFPLVGRGQTCGDYSLKP